MTQGIDRLRLLRALYRLRSDLAEVERAAKLAGEPVPSWVGFTGKQAEQWTGQLDEDDDLPASDRLGSVGPAATPYTGDGGSGCNRA